MQRSAEWHEQRQKYIGGSDANIIMSGDPDAVHDLWLLKTGQKEPDDLSWVLPVQIGQATEKLNIKFYEKATFRKVSSRNERFRVNHLVAEGMTSFLPIMCCEVDGITETNPAIVVEAKHVSGYSDIEAVVQKYMPQLHHNMICTGLRLADLSVIRDNTQHKIFNVEYDPFYGRALLEAEAAFWQCVVDMVPPDPAYSPKPPVPVDKTIVISMAGNNEWGDAAARWLENEKAKKEFDKAVKDIKALVPVDAGKAHGHGIVASRSSSGSLTIKAGNVT
jgi:predicted phage-related endonuclease